MVGMLAVIIGLLLVAVKIGVFVKMGVSVAGTVGEISGVLVASITTTSTPGVLVDGAGVSAAFVN